MHAHLLVGAKSRRRDLLKIENTRMWRMNPSLKRQLAIGGACVACASVAFGLSKNAQLKDVSSPDAAVASLRPYAVDLKELLAHPSKYEGKRVIVRGYGSLRDEWSGGNEEQKSSTEKIEMVTIGFMVGLRVRPEAGQDANSGVAPLSEEEGNNPAQYCIWSERMPVDDSNNLYDKVVYGHLIGNEEITVIGDFGKREDGRGHELRISDIF